MRFQRYVSLEVFCNSLCRIGISTSIDTIPLLLAGWLIMFVVFETFWA
jgi:hypothetical protein